MNPYTYKRIKLSVKQSKITLNQLAEGTGISINTIRKWGQGAEPTLGNLMTIARYLDVSLDYLVGTTDERYSHKTKEKIIYEAWAEVQAVAQQKMAELQAADSIEEELVLDVEDDAE